MAAAKARKRSTTTSASGSAPGHAAAASSPAVSRWLKAGVLAVAISAIAPYVPMNVMPFTSPYATRFAALLVSAVVWLAVWAFRPAEFAAARRVHAAAASVAAFALVAAVLAPVPGAAMTWGAEGGFMGVPTWAALLIVFAMSSRLRTTAEVRQASLVAVAWGALVALQVMVERVDRTPITAGFGNANYVVAVLLLLTGVALGAAYEPSLATYRKQLLWLAAVLAVGVAVAGPLTGYVGLVAMLGAGALVAGTFGMPARWVRVIRPLGAAALVVLLLAGTVSLVAVFSDVLPARVDSAVEARVLGPTVVTRVGMWRAAAGVIADRPLLGVGPDGMQLASQSHLSAQMLALEGGAAGDVRTLIRDPHSLPLLALVSLGILGTAALVWLLVEWVRALLAAGVARPAEGPSRPLRAWRTGLALGVFGYLVAMLFIPWPIAIGPLAPLFAGLVIAPARDEDVRETAAPDGSVSPGWAVPWLARGLAFALAVVFAAWLSWGAIVGDYAIAQARQQSDPLIAQSYYRRAADAQPTRSYPAYEALYAQGFMAADGLADIGQYQQSVDAAQPGIRANGAYLANLVQNSLDQAYLTGRRRLEWEKRTLEAAIADAPNHPDVQMEVAHLALLEGDARRAGEMLDKAGKVAAGSERYRLYRLYEARLLKDPRADDLAEELFADVSPAVRRLVPAVD